MVKGVVECTQEAMSERDNGLVNLRVSGLTGFLIVSSLLGTMRKTIIAAMRDMLVGQLNKALACLWGCHTSGAAGLWAAWGGKPPRWGGPISRRVLAQGNWHPAPAQTGGVQREPSWYPPQVGG